MNTNNNKTVANIRSAIKERVTTRNATNITRITRDNAIPANQIFARGAIVSFLILKAIRLAGKLWRIYAQVI